MTITLTPPSTAPAPERAETPSSTGGSGLGRSIALSFLPDRAWSAKVYRWAPVALIVIVQIAFATIKLTGPAWGDEGLYAWAGRQEIDHVLHGTPIAPYRFGAYFSGAPGLYPVVSGGLDIVGGLALTRTFSALCIAGVSICVYLIGERLVGRGAAIAGTVLFACTSSTVYLSHLATYDAPTMLLLLATAALFLRRTGWRVFVAGGVLLALAVALKYAALLWVPSVLLLPIAERRTWAAVRRSAVAGAITTVLLGVGYLAYRTTLEKGIVSTTLQRDVIASTPLPNLLVRIAEEVGPIMLLIVVGAVLRWRTDRAQRWTLALLVITVLLAPLHQLQIREETSLIKHADFGVAFAAPLAGWVVVAFGRRFSIALGVAAIAALGWFTVAYGDSYSHFAASTPQEIAAVEHYAKPGTMVESSEATATLYYDDLDSREGKPGVPGASSITWTFPIESSIARAEPEVLALNNSPTGSPGKDAERKREIAMAMHDPRYRLVSDTEQIPGDPSYRWYVWVKVAS